MSAATSSAPTTVPGPVPRRIALYSHDTQGLGHIRRNLALARAFTGMASPATVLLLSGVPEARSFTLPPHTDCLTLPSLAKEASGSYRPGALTASLDDVVELRAAAIRAAVERFSPDVLVVDKVARGACGELEATLEVVASRRDARLVLGLRDVLDEPAATRREWHATATNEAVLEFYDELWIYGDVRVFDAVAAYDWPPQVADRVRYTGYLAPQHLLSVDGTEGDRQYDLCLVGGGQDGLHLAEAFLAARHPAGVEALVITGPYMTDDHRGRLEARAGAHPGARVVRFAADTLRLIAGARSVVAMGGYNTAIELITHSRRALIVPRVSPRREQLVRAARLAELGLVECWHPTRLTTARLSAWLADDAAQPRGGRDIDLLGLGRVQHLLSELLAEESMAAGPRRAWKVSS